MSFCKNCGASINDTDSFCTKCGAKIDVTNNTADTANMYAPIRRGGTNRNIALCIIFSIITCGIYSLYWWIKVNDESLEILGEGGTSGLGVVILSLITCGIYGIYWSYQMGQRVDRMKGNPNGNTAIMFLILSIFALSIVNFCIIQDTINSKAA